MGFGHMSLSHFGIYDITQILTLLLKKILKIVIRFQKNQVRYILKLSRISLWWWVEGIWKSDAAALRNLYI